MANSLRTAPDGSWRPDANWRGVLPSTYLDYSQWNNLGGPAINAGLACPNYKALERSVFGPPQPSLFTSLPLGCVPQPWWPGYDDEFNNGKVRIVSQEPMYLVPVKEEWCRSVKGKGLGLMTLYATYDLAQTKEMPSLHSYTKYRLVPELPKHMRNCATKPDFAFSANDHSSIVAAIDAMFAAAVASVGGNIRLIR